MTQPANYQNGESIEQYKVAFDQQLLNAKKNRIQQFLRLQQDSSDSLANYPNQLLQKLATSQLKEHGHLLLFKSTTTVYFGEVCNQFYHGYGLLIYKSNGVRFYEGNFQNNCKYGYGLEYINGDLYVGRFINNKPEDQNGIFVWSNQDIYHGSFVNGMKHGQGKWQSGDQFYSGSWKYNKPQGQGFIKSALSEYKGQVRNGYKHGNGVELFNNGDRYEGNYSNGKPEGNGSYFWSNGSIYKGQFKNGLRFGYGVWQLGNQKYEGTYINDKRNGEGKYIWAGGSFYIGTFVEDLRHGFGEMHWEEDSFYKGQWFEGSQNGEGQVWEKGKLIQKGFYQKGKIKITAIKQDTERRIIPIPNKMVKPMKNQILSNNQKQRFNSFHNQSVDHNHRQSKNQKTTNHLEILKKNQNRLEKRKQVNKRYSVLEKITDKSKNLPKKQNLNITKGQDSAKNYTSKPKQQSSMPKISMNKINIYKKLRKERKSEIIDKSKPLARLSKSFQTEGIMFETQLAPIKWKNFNHINY